MQESYTGATRRPRQHAADGDDQSADQLVQALGRMRPRERRALDADAAPRRALRLGWKQIVRWGLVVGLIAVVVRVVPLAVVLVIAHWSDHPKVPTPALLLIVLAPAVAVAIPIVHEIFYWHRPLKRLRRTLSQVQAGEATIDELDHVHGQLHPLAASIADIMRELRQQEAERNQLEHEVRQRIANRTDALERQVDSLRHRASTDGLTRLQNRRALDEYLPQVVSQCVAEHSDMCLMMIDVDHFKLLNDSLGHAAGDDLLHTFASLIRSSIREQDAAFRYGGDEFVVAMPRAGRDQGVALGKRLVVLSHEAGRLLHLPRTPKLSVGLAVMSELRDATADELLRQADASLYTVKRAGREGTEPAAASTTAARTARPR